MSPGELEAIHEGMKPLQVEIERLRKQIDMAIDVLDPEMRGRDIVNLREALIRTREPRHDA